MENNNTQKDIDYLWKEICFLMNPEKTATLDEMIFEQKVLLMFEKIGWSQFEEEIIIKKKIPIGSNNILIPDLIIKNKKNNESFVIEIKRPSLKLDNEKYKNQLFSYMRQLKIDIGVLVGENIQIFYDGPIIKQEYPLRIAKYDFDYNKSENPLKLLHKENFITSNISMFINDKIVIMKKNDEEKRFKKYIESERFSEEIKIQITDFLKNDWDYDIVENVLSEYNFELHSLNENKINDKEIGQNNSKIVKKSDNYLNRKDIKNLLESIEDIEMLKHKLSYSNLNKTTKWTFEIAKEDIYEGRYLTLIENNKSKMYVFKLGNNYLGDIREKLYLRNDNEKYRFEINSKDNKDFMEIHSKIKFIDKLIKTINI